MREGRIMEKLIIDRFEGDYAICERADKTKIDILRKNMPSTLKEGDCIILNEDQSITFDEEETKAREKRIKSLMDSLFED